METFTQRDIDLAWAAGFFEGEGCFYAHYHRPRHDGSKRMIAEASITQKDEGLIRRFQEVVGFGCVYLGTKKIWIWKTTKKGEAEKLVDLIGGQLGDRRIRRAKEIMEQEAAQIDMRGTANRRKAAIYADGPVSRPGYNADSDTIR